MAKKKVNLEKKVVANKPDKRAKSVTISEGFKAMTSKPRPIIKKK